MGQKLKKRERDVRRGRSAPDNMVGVPGTSSGAVRSHRRPVSRNVTKTSTPVKVKALKNRECKRGKFIKRRSLQVAERKLREAARISFSPSSR